MVLKPDLKKDQKDKLLTDVKKLIGDVKGDKAESLGEKKFSYPLKRERRGEFIVIAFQAESISQDFNKRLRIKEEVLRHLLVRN